MGDKPLLMSEEWEAQYNKAGRLWFLGVDVQENPGGAPEARSCLCICQASFLMTFATGRIPHAGSRQFPKFYHTNTWIFDILLFIFCLFLLGLFVHNSWDQIYFLSTMPTLLG